MNNEIYTVGYSPHTATSFIEVLKLNRIDVVADVRSIPYSRFYPQFNMEALRKLLEGVALRYVFMGDALGARCKFQSCYVNGRVDYDYMAKHPAFQHGLERLCTGMRDYRIALMCAEKDPITCHRTILICRNLKMASTIKHILPDGTTEEHIHAEERLLKVHHLDTDELPAFGRTKEERLAIAYKLQGEKIAYKEESVTTEQLSA